MTLREFRQLHGLSLAEMAERLGVHSARTVQRYEAGERIPEPDVMRRIVMATGGAVTPNAFYQTPTPAAAPQPQHAAANDPAEAA
ncbi:helix-turn-helix domain-containing protein [Caldovatus sediminis]|nr:helix-turn-helix transcriptional regulator [Caldovatus sediminis]